MIAKILEYGRDTLRPNETSALSMQSPTEACKDVSSKEHYAHVRNLNAGQRKTAMHICAWCNKVFNSGPGGTCKSHVINIIHRDIMFFFQKIEGEADKPLVLLTAPTSLQLSTFLE